jgi:hypothetical protein
MSSQKRSPVAIASEAVARAEKALADLPLSPDVRELHRRVSAVKTVLFGIARSIPTLRARQREQLGYDAVVLMNEVLEVRRSHRREPIEAIGGLLAGVGSSPLVGKS